MRPAHLIIGGEFVKTSDNAEIRNPATGEAVGFMPMASLADVDAAVEAARQAFPGWSARTPEERAAALVGIADLIESHADELARLLTLEQGKPLNGLGSRFEIGGAAAWTRATAALELPVEVLVDAPGERIELHRKPIGVVGSITPWNWPVIIACWHIMPAIRVGNTVVVKPSPNTPLTTIQLVELINQVLPPGVVNIVTGSNEIGGYMSRHPGIDKITFTGSTATGRKVMESAAQTLKRLTLELGGNDAGIVLPDAVPQAIAENLFWGAFMNSGQSCTCLKRLYVHDSLYDGVCRELVAYANKVKLGDGLSEDFQIGPLQNKMQYDIVASCVEDARAKGGRILIGGDPAEGPGYFYPITIVADVDDGCRLVDIEQFGPALPIIRYHDLEDAIAKANSTSMGLGGSVWGRDMAEMKRVAERLECGSVWLNKHSYLHPMAPFGGVKQSGLGVEFGVEGLKEFTVAQSVFC